MLGRFFSWFTFVVGQAKKTLLEDPILPIPKGERDTESLVVIRQASKTILAPSIGPRSRMVVWEESPGVSVPTVILAHRRLLSQKRSEGIA
jgi:hypothetical protein